MRRLQGSAGIDEAFASRAALYLGHDDEQSPYRSTLPWSGRVRWAALAVAAFFLIVATAYWFVSYDPGGSFLIGMVGATIGLGAFALLRGSANIY